MVFLSPLCVLIAMTTSALAFDNAIQEETTLQCPGVCICNNTCLSEVENPNGCKELKCTNSCYCPRQYRYDRSKRVCMQRLKCTRALKRSTTTTDLITEKVKESVNQSSTEGCNHSNGSKHLYSAQVVAYVGGNGTNNRSCGTEQSPCQNISYIINHLYRSSETIMVKVLSDVVETSPIHIDRPANFSIAGVGDNRPVLAHLWSQQLFWVYSRSGVSIMLTVRNIVVHMRSLNSFFKLLSRSKPIVVTLVNTTFVQIEGQGDLGKDEYPFFAKNYHGLLNIKICSCTFKNFKSLHKESESHYLLYLQNGARLAINLTLTNTIFVNNTFKWGVIEIECTDDRLMGTSANIYISGCAFVNNNVQKSLIRVLKIFNHIDLQLENTNFTTNHVSGENGLILVPKTHLSKMWTVNLVRINADGNKGTLLHVTYSGSSTITLGAQIKVMVTLCTFSNNKTPLRGGGIVVDSKEGKSGVQLVNFTVCSSLFYENSAQAGGAISSNVLTRITESEFLMNEAHIGGAINLFEGSVNTVWIMSCVFTNNKALLRGGAIVTALESSTMMLIIQSSRFYRNNAITGGAVSSNAQTRIRKSEFIVNHATIGGAIMLVGFANIVQGSNTRNPDDSETKVSEISESNITTTTNALYSSARLDVENLSVRLLSQSQPVISVKLVDHDSSSQYLRIAGKVSFECGHNQYMKNKTSRPRYPFRHVPGGNVSKFFAALSVTCHSCSIGSYSAGRAVASWKVSSGNVTEALSNNNCFACPRGGDCSSGPLRSRKGYWGYKKKRSKEVEFAKCADGYCSPNPHSFDSCADNRNSVLCGECKANTLLSLFSSECIDIGACDYSSFYYMVSIFPCVVSVVVVCVIFKAKLKSTSKRLAKKFRHCFETAADENEDDVQSHEDNDGTSRLKQFFLLLTFYQMATLIYIPNRFSKNHVIPDAWAYIQHVLGMISMQSFVGGANSGDVTNYCFPPGFTFIRRTFLNVLLNVSPIILLMFILIVVSCYERSTKRKAPLKLQVQGALVNLLNIVCIPLTKNLFQLINCVTIIQDEEEVLVLVGQGSSVCFNTWQKGIIVFISVYLVWYFFFLYVGVLYLEQQRYKEFLIMAFLPITSIFFFLKLKVEQYQKRQLVSMPVRYTAHSGNFVAGEDGSVEFVRIVLQNKQPHENQNNIDEHLAVKDNTQTFDSICGKLVEVIQGSCKLKYWPAIAFLKKFCVGLTPVLFHSDYSQTLALIFVTFIYFSLLVKTTPYTDRIMNMMEPILMSLLLLLGVFGIINTAYQSVKDNNIEYLLTIIEYTQFVVLLLPLPLWIVCTAIQKYTKHDSSSDQSANPSDKSELASNRPDTATIDYDTPSTSKK